MIVRPAACVDLGPEIGLFWACDADGDAAGKSSCRLNDRLIENAGHLNGAVSALAKHGQGLDSGERADFMEDLRSALAKEALNRIQSGGAQFLKEAKAKCLRAGRVNPIEDGIGSAAFDPCGSACWRMTATGFSLLDTSESFCTFKASRQIKVGEEHADQCRDRARRGARV